MSRGVLYQVEFEGFSHNDKKFRFISKKKKKNFIVFLCKFICMTNHYLFLYWHFHSNVIWKVFSWIYYFTSFKFNSILQFQTFLFEDQTKLLSCIDLPICYFSKFNCKLIYCTWSFFSFLLVDRKKIGRIWLLAKISILWAFLLA